MGIFLGTFNVRDFFQVINSKEQKICMKQKRLRLSQKRVV